MAIYLDQKVDTGSSAGSTTKHELLEWHPKFDYLAVSSYDDNLGGEVNFFTDKGGVCKRAPANRARCRATCVKWHPDRDILAIGWSDGTVSFCIKHDLGDEQISLASQSPGPISCLEWNSNGLRLLIADTTGESMVYKIDHRGHPHSAPFCQNQAPEGLRKAVLKPPNKNPVLVGLAARYAGGGTSDDETLEATSTDTLDVFTVRMKAANAAAAVARGEQPPSNNNAAESSTFFLGGDQGTVFCLRDGGSLQACCRCDRTVFHMFYYEEKDVLLVIDEGLMLYQHRVLLDLRTEEIMRVKLTGKMPNFRVIWTDSGLLVMCSGDPMIRLWDLDTEDNCVLQAKAEKGYTVGEAFLALSHSKEKGMLAAITSGGQIAMWKRDRKKTEGDLGDQWRLQTATQLAAATSPVKVSESEDEGGGAATTVSAVMLGALKWAHNSGCLAVISVDGRHVTILQEQIMLSHFNSPVAAIQSGPASTAVIRVDSLSGVDVKPLDMSTIGGVHVSDTQLTLWNGTKVSIYELPSSGAGDNAVSAVVGAFPSDTQTAASYQQSVYTVDGAKLNVRTFQGTVKQVITLAEQEGEPVLMDVRAGFLCIATSTGFVKVFDLSRREARQQHHAKYIVEGLAAEFQTITSIKINCAGNKVSCCMQLKDDSLDPRLYVWDAESDTVVYFNFKTAMTDMQEYEKEVDKIDRSYQRDLKNRTPGFHCWDANDPRLLVCEAQSKGTFFMEENHVAIFFVTSENGILIQDSFPKGPACDSLLGLDVPYLYFTKQLEEDSDREIKSELESLVSQRLIRRILREFVGLESGDASTKKAMLDFSFYLTVGNMDEAFKAIKLIKSESVWENMAQMCVKTRRLDVAAVCLGNMGLARGARSLRRTMRNEKQLEVQVAMLAVQLGMIEDAGNLYRSCDRYDLLNRLMETTNQWKTAFEIAQKNDRIHLRNTYYNYAGYLESIGAVEQAIECYEKSDTHRFEVPRMLFDDPIVLEQYVKRKKDVYLQKWWAQYLESLGEMENAKSYYSAASDHLSVVRICCYLEDKESAATVVNDTNDKAAAYHLAREYENDGQITAAVHFYGKADAYTSAIRLAKEHSLEDKIAHFSLMSGGESEMLEAARYYENKSGQADKAVMLYYKAGMFGRALELAFRTEQFSALDQIVGELDESADPKVLERCAEFFTQNQQYDKAVQLLAYAKKYREAIDVCISRNVPISEKLAEALTPTKDAIPNAQERQKLLEQIADACVQQGNYHYAAKKYTQAGMKTEAMRALLKSGDTEKVVQFAQIARSKDIFVMAANYLQTVNWKEDPDVMKQIVNFYTKGGAFASLAMFYDACAQVEIDDYRDYEKAQAALQEAIRCLARAGDDSRNSFQLQERQDDYNRKIAFIKKFLNIRTVYEADPADAMQQLLTLSEQPNISESVRLGDIYAVLIIHNVKKDNHKKAHSYIEELKKRVPRVDVSRYVRPQILDAVYAELNLPSEYDSNQQLAATEDDGDIVPESMSLQRNLKQHETIESILSG